MNEYPLIPQHGMEKCKENEAGSQCEAQEDLVLQHQRRKHMMKRLEPVKSNSEQLSLQETSGL